MASSRVFESNKLQATKPPVSDGVKAKLLELCKTLAETIPTIVTKLEGIFKSLSGETVSVVPLATVLIVRNVRNALSYFKGKRKKLSNVSTLDAELLSSSPPTFGVSDMSFPTMSSEDDPAKLKSMINQMRIQMEEVMMQRFHLEMALEYHIAQNKELSVNLQRATQLNEELANELNFLKNSGKKPSGNSFLQLSSPRNVEQ